MTAFARKVLSELPEPTSAGCREQLLDPPGVHQQHRQDATSRATSRSTNALSGFAPLRLPRRRHRRQAAAAAAVGRKRQRLDLRHEQAVRQRASPGPAAARRCSKAGSAGRGPSRARTRWRSAHPAALDAYGISGLPTDERIAGGLPTQLITGFSDLGRQATNPQWQYPEVFNPKINYTWVVRAPLAEDRLRVPAHHHRGAGRQPALRPRCLRRADSRRGRPARPPTTSTTSPTSCSASAASTRSATS